MHPWVLIKILSHQEKPQTVKHHLPNSPRKKVAVVRILFMDIIPSEEEDNFFIKRKVVNANMFLSIISLCPLESYFSYFSYSTLISTLEDLHFFNLRPPFVLSLSALPHNICACIYHENFKYLTTSLSGVLTNFPSFSKEIIFKVSCDIHNETCMRKNCEKCKNIGYLKHNTFNAETTISSKQQLQRFC